MQGRSTWEKLLNQRAEVGRNHTIRYAPYQRGRPMEKGSLVNALDRVRLFAAHERCAQLSDGMLLERCVSGTDEAAFTVLVEAEYCFALAVDKNRIKNVDVSVSTTDDE
jgi:hypothetical protein